MGVTVDEFRDYILKIMDKLHIKIMDDDSDIESFEMKLKGDYSKISEILEETLEASNDINDQALYLWNWYGDKETNTYTIEIARRAFMDMDFEFDFEEDDSIIEELELPNNDD